ncbi:MAG: hypothetical protein CL920_35595 [Deltaproteobacteria bacterium]|nr:hypothetical protein [Deltaproteobacteria bacterium]
MSTAYTEHTPSTHLSSTIECYWSFTALEDSQHIVLPDGCVDLLFCAYAGAYSLRWVGTMTEARVVHSRRGMAYIGFRCKPGMASSLLSVPQLPDANQSKIWTEALQLSSSQQRSLLHSDTEEERIYLLESALLSSEEPSPVQHAIQYVQENRGLCTIDELCDIAHVSARQLRRLCHLHTGVSPKMLLRLARFRHLCDLLGSSAHTLAELAVMCGYYDQAHMNREFKSFAGLHPTAYQATLL